MRYFPRELDLLHGLTMICASPRMDHKSQGTNQSINQSVTFGTVRIVSVRPSVCLSVCRIIRPHQWRAAGLLLSVTCRQVVSINSGERRAPGSNDAATRGRSTALSSKFAGRCYDQSRDDEAEHRLVRITGRKTQHETAQRRFFRREKETIR